MFMPMSVFFSSVKFIHAFCRTSIIFLLFMIMFYPCRLNIRTVFVKQASAKLPLSHPEVKGLSAYTSNDFGPCYWKLLINYCLLLETFLKHENPLLAGYSNTEQFAPSTISVDCYFQHPPLATIRLRPPSQPQAKKLSPHVENYSYWD